MRKTLAALATMAVLAAAPAMAADNGFYLGGSLGRSSLKDDIGPVKFDGNDTGFKLIAGFRALNWLAVEANYIDFGKPDDTVAGVPVQADGKGVAAFAVGFIPAGPLDIYAKAGLINWDAKLRASSFRRDEDGTDFAYGAGAQFRLGSLAFRVEYEKFDADVNDLNMLSVGVTWTFL